MRTPRPLVWLASAWVLLFSLVCVIFPITAVFYRVFSASGVLGRLFDPGVLAVLRATVLQAGLSAGISLAIGLAFGLWIVRRGGLGRGLRALLSVPFAVPTVVVGIAGVAWLGRSGILRHLGVPLDWAYSLKGVILAHVFLNASWAAFLIAEARAQVPFEELAAARTLGAGPLACFRHVVWPRIRWSCASLFVQIFALCAMSFALVLLLGGGPPVDTLETAIYSNLRNSWLDVSKAACCALWELAVTLTPWVLLLVLRSRARLAKGGVRACVPRPRRDGLAMGAACVAILPYLALLSLPTWQIWRTPGMGAQLGGPVWLSVRLAVSATLLAVVTAVAGVIASRRSVAASFLLSVPSGISVLVLGLGFWLGFGRWVDPFDGSFVAMAVLQGTLLVPLVFRALWPLTEGIQAGLLQAAATLGASPWHAFWFVEWPRWRGPLFAVSATALGAALGEVAAVSLFYNERLIPLPLLITRWMSQYRFEEAGAVAALLFVLSAGTVALVAVWGGAKEVNG